MFFFCSSKQSIYPNVLQLFLQQFLWWCLHSFLSRYLPFPACIASCLGFYPCWETSLICWLVPSPIPLFCSFSNPLWFPFPAFYSPTLPFSFSAMDDGVVLTMICTIPPKIQCKKEVQELLIAGKMYCVWLKSSKNTSENPQNTIKLNWK